MSGFMNFLMVLAYLAAAHGFWMPASAWVAADREKGVWIGLLLIPGINIFVLIAYAIGVLPLLLPHHTPSTTNPLRRGSTGGHATTSTWRR